ncbi:hypothetical protein [Tenacibaculum sp. SDUM215027]|uniref:hypothetical protein n=1 Tax=Tenacibaculum sp. SDUM215027 TaxID=3422596 RepID=UPI003D310694
MKNEILVTYSTKLMKMEIFLFLFFILITILFNIDTNAHKYFNESGIVYNFHRIFALLMTFCYGVFFWICICFPFLWLVQLIILISKKYFKKYWKLFLLVTVFYLGSLVAWFSLYSINQHQNFKGRRNQITKINQGGASLRGMTCLFYVFAKNDKQSRL